MQLTSRHLETDGKASTVASAAGVELLTCLSRQASGVVPACVDVLAQDFRALLCI